MEEHDSEILFKWTNSCRLCLETETDVDIFTADRSLEVLPKLQACLNLLIYSGDPMPRKLCSKCLHTLNEWMKFRDACLQTEQDLKRRLQPYRKIEFVQDYFDRVAKFTSSEIVSSSCKVMLKVPTVTCSEVNSSTHSKTFPDELSNESAGSPKGCVSSMSDTEDLGKDVESSMNKALLEPQIEINITEPCCEGEGEGGDWAECEDASVGTILSVTGSAGALWTGHTGYRVAIKTEAGTKTCPQCEVEFPSEEHFELHSCLVMDCDDAYPEDDLDPSDFVDSSLRAEDDESSSGSVRRSQRHRTQVRRLCDEVTSVKTSRPCPLVHKAKDPAAVGGRSQMTPWKCIPCARYFLSSHALDEHYRSRLCNSNYTDVFKCEFCPRQYTSYHELLQHQVVHVRVRFRLTDDDLVCCAHCDLRFAGPRRLDRHSLVHDSQHVPRGTEFPCGECGEVYIKRELYERHLAGHRDPGPAAKGDDGGAKSAGVRCRQCGLMCGSQQELDRHEALKHKNPTPYLCRKCGFRFSVRSQLLMHLRSHLPKSDPDYCPSTEAELEALNSPSHRCQVCQAKFLYATDLDLHMKTHKTARPAPQQPAPAAPPQPAAAPLPGELLARYKCSLCTKVTVHPFSIIRHGHQQHKGEKVVAQRLKRPIPVFRHAPYPGMVKHKAFRAKCSQCYKSFSSQANLNVHVSTVHVVVKKEAGEEEAAGAGAGQGGEEGGLGGLSALGGLGGKTASTDGMEECPYCNKSFKRSYLRQHVKRNHRGQAIDRSSLGKEITADSSLVCRYCFKVCSTIYNRELHESIHTPGSGKSTPSTCTSCNKTFYHKFIYERHVRTCNIAKSFHCSVCNKLFFKFSAFQKHSCQMQEDAVHECAECGAKFASPHLLQVHVNNSHGGSWAPSTSSAFQEAKPLKDHKELELWQEESNKIVCKVDDKYYCTLCDCEFSTAEECREHQAFHPRGNWYAVQINDSLFQCTICDKFFDTRTAALHHIDYHKQSTDPPPPPPLLEAALLKSKTTTAGIKRNFRCPFCISTFATQENLSNHIFYVHPEGSYQ